MCLSKDRRVYESPANLKRSVTRGWWRIEESDHPHDSLFRKVSSVSNISVIHSDNHSARHTPPTKLSTRAKTLRRRSTPHCDTSGAVQEASAVAASSARLETLYGSRASLLPQSKEETGTPATFTITIKSSVGQEAHLQLTAVYHLPSSCPPICQVQRFRCA